MSYPFSASQVEDATLFEIDGRIDQNRFSQFQPERHWLLANPLTGQEVLLNPARSKREFEVKEREDKPLQPENCQFCRLKTPPTLFAIGADAGIILPDLTKATAIMRDFLGSKSETEKRQWQTYRDAAELVTSDNHAGLAGHSYLARCFFNLTPAAVSEMPETCFMVSGNPSDHYGEWNDLPPESEQAMIMAWQVLEKCQRVNMPKGITVPFVNAGKKSASGQSIFCNHSQVYCLAELPALYKHIRSVIAAANSCPLCAMIDEYDLTVWQNDYFRVSVHPVPEYNLTLRVSPLFEIDYVSDLNGEGVAGLASAINQAVSFLAQLMGSVPAYNILIRSGVGHLYAEIVPRSGCNIHAGAEKTTGIIIATQNPADIAAVIRERIN